MRATWSEVEEPAAEEAAACPGELYKTFKGCREPLDFTLFWGVGDGPWCEAVRVGRMSQMACGWAVSRPNQALSRAGSLA